MVQQRVPTDEHGGLNMVSLWQSLDGAVTNLMTAYAPEAINWSISAEWEPTLANTIQNSLNSAGVKELADVFTASTGYVPRFQAVSIQFFQGTAPVAFTLPLQFRAETDPQKDVVEPVKRLMQATLPTLTKLKSLRAPAANSVDLGGLVSGTFSGGQTTLKDGQIDLHIGRFLIVPDMFIRSVAPNMPTRFTEKGLPLEMDVEVTLETRVTPTAEDVLNWFVGG